MASKEIYNLQCDIIAKLESSRREKNSTSRQNGISVVQNKLLPNLLEKRMQRDMPNISQTKKTELLNDIKDFISLGKEKEYFTDSNIIDVLKQLTFGLNKFTSLPESATYGTWSGCRGSGSIELDLNKEKNFLRHIVFHELAHCVTPDLGPISASTVESNKPGHSVEGFRSKRKQFVRKDGYEFGWNNNEIIFLRECIAESMACELDGMYKAERKSVSDEPGVTSDWVTPYNRTYQQMGDEFLQTLSFIATKENDTDRKRFKALTMMALDPNNQIAKKIDEEYNRKGKKSGSKDLENITTGLSNLLNRTFVNKKEVVALRKEMNPYQKNPKFTIFRRSDTTNETSNEDTQEKIMTLFNSLSIEAQVEAYAKIYNLNETAKQALHLFMHLSPETKKEFFDKMQKEEREDRIKE